MALFWRALGVRGSGELDVRGDFKEGLGSCIIVSRPGKIKSID